jgi:uncharacterized protein (PEP-CTERM system associated)
MPRTWSRSPFSVSRLVIVTGLVAAAPAVIAQIGIWTPPAAPTAGQAVGPQLGGVVSPAQGRAGVLSPYQTPAGGAQPSSWSASVLLQETATNNVNLQPSSSAEDALVTEITPRLAVNHRGPRTTLFGNVSLPVVLYLPSGAASDRVYPAVNLLGDVMVVDNLVYIEGQVNVSQQFFDPFGAQPPSLSNPTNNRYRSDNYRVSPYIRGSTSAGTNYELRNDNVWSNLSGAPISTSNSSYTSFSGVASNIQTTLGWQVSFNYTDTRFNNQQNSLVTQIYRASPVYRVDPNLRVSATGGFEENQGYATSSRGAIYGVGFVWQPTPNTNVTGDWESRFFGSSYRFSYEHVSPLSVWNLRFSRNITSYPQQLATVPGGVNVAGFLDSLFIFLIPDPLQRQNAVNQFIQDRGLPATLVSPVNVYTEQILLQQYVGGTIGLIGARNTVFMTAYSARNEPIAASGAVLPPLLATGNNNVQNGGTIVWTHQLTPSLSSLFSADGQQTLARGGSVGNTKQGLVRFVLSTTLTPSTTAFAGARYQALQSDVSSDYIEAAVFVGIGYRFR